MNDWPVRCCYFHTTPEDRVIVAVVEKLARLGIPDIIRAERSDRPTAEKRYGEREEDVYLVAPYPTGQYPDAPYFTDRPPRMLILLGPPPEPLSRLLIPTPNGWKLAGGDGR